MHRTIQSGTHDSIEDSIAVMELIKLKVANPELGSITQLEAVGENIFNVLHEQKRRSTMIDVPFCIQRYSTNVVSCIPVCIPSIYLFPVPL